MSRSRKQWSATPIVIAVPDNLEDMPMAQWRVVMLPLFQYLCGRMEHWQRCPLARCRRARVCTGSNDLNRRDHRFPPCMRDDADHAALIRELGLYIAELERTSPGVTVPA